MKRFLMAAGLAVSLHGLLLSTEAEWMKKKDIHPFRPQPIALTLSYQKPQERSSLDQKESEEVTKISIPLKKSRKREQVRSKPPKKIKQTTVTKTPRSQKKITRASQKTEHQPLKPEEKTDSQATPDIIQPLKQVKQDFSPGRQGQPSPPPIREAIPIYRNNPSPKYPRVARRRGYQGTVVIEALVNREGKVEDLRLFHSSGYRVLDRAAMKSVKNWVFEPGRRGDEEVEMWVKIPVRFQLK